MAGAVLHAMQAVSAGIDFDDRAPTHSAHAVDGAPAELPHHRALHVGGAVVALIALLFFADLRLPPGATPAIGYCLVVLVAGRVRDARFLLPVVATCTALTWFAYYLEPPTLARWHASFERGMVTSVIWLTALIAWRREQALAALEHARHQLQRSNAELERFAAIASHDLRAPLSSVMLALDLLASSDVAARSENDRTLIDSMRGELRDMGRLISSLLAESQVDAAPLNLGPCDSAATLERAQRFLRVEIDDADAGVTHDALPVVHADCALLTQLFQNLVQNAIKYRRSNVPPAVQVHATGDGRGGWIFSVRDNGLGIAPEDQSRIFELYHRAKNGSARRAAGNGIGLAVCRRIVARHGGHIWVESEPGAGSVLSFTLPRRSA
jgi:signal transduction histidine kinase